MDRRSLLAALAAGAAGVVTGLPGVARSQERKADDLKKRTEDAVEKGLKKAGQSVKNIKGAWVNEIKVVTSPDGKVAEWRVNLKISFIVD